MERSFSEVLDFIQKIDLLVEERTKKQLESLPEDAYMSADVEQLMEALSQAQGEYPIIKYNQENPYLKMGFSDLNMLMSSVYPILSAHGLSITQQERTLDGATMLHTRLWHGKQWIESRNKIASKNDEQSYASSLIFYKRHSLMSLIGLSIADDPYDDDGEESVHETRKVKAKGTELGIQYNPKQQSKDTITREQLDELEYELSDYPEIAEDIIDKLKIRTLADMPKSKFHASALRIREIKNLRNGVK